VKFSVRPFILLNSRECSPLGVNKGVSISPRGQISPLGAKFKFNTGGQVQVHPWGPSSSSPLGVKFTPGGPDEVKNGPQPCNFLLLTVSRNLENFLIEVISSSFSPWQTNQNMFCRLSLRRQFAQNFKTGLSSRVAKWFIFIPKSLFG
jgi:hypothetical protein